MNKLFYILLIFFSILYIGYSNIILHYWNKSKFYIQIFLIIILIITFYKKPDSLKLLLLNIINKTDPQKRSSYIIRELYNNYNNNNFTNIKKSEY